MVLCYDSPEKLLHTPKNENKEQWALATPRVILRPADPVPLGNTVGPKPVLLAHSLLFTNPSRCLTHTFNFEKHSYREVGLQIGWTIHSKDTYYTDPFWSVVEKKRTDKNTAIGHLWNAASGGMEAPGGPLEEAECVWLGRKWMSLPATTKNILKK